MKTVYVLMSKMISSKVSPIDEAEPLLAFSSLDRAMEEQSTREMISNLNATNVYYLIKEINFVE